MLLRYAVPLCTCQYNCLAQRKREDPRRLATDTMIAFQVKAPRASLHMGAGALHFATSCLTFLSLRHGEAERAKKASMLALGT